MTLIAGIVSRNPNRSVPASARDSLRRLISRDPRDEIGVFKDQRSFFVKVDIGAYGEPSVKADENGTLTLLTGEPLLGPGSEGKWQGRETDAASIHDGCVRGDWSILRTANGVFSAIHYQPSTGELILITDKLGIRPLYYWIDEDYVVFASALRILENLAEIPKKMDVRAVTEIAGLGYPLGDRTPYTDIFMVKAAEIVRITEKNISRQNYWRWDEIEPSLASEEDLLSEVHRRFDSAVARRIRKDTATAAYLSGGLDSRCIAAALHAQNVRIHTFNFARPNTQDQVLGLEFAREINAIHMEVPKQPGDLVPDYSSLMAAVWAASANRRVAPAERPAIVWSGEGGSVALGHVHLSEAIVALMRTGQIDSAIEEYVRREYVHVSPKLFRTKVSTSLAGVINRGIREELANLHCRDKARNFYLYLLLNDQHRKLAGHFENIDLHRLEFQLPFFDSDVLTAIAAVPIDLCLRHEFYVKWLALFPPAVTSVAWQVYPGHQPCPVPVPAGFAYQWSNEYQSAERSTQKRREVKQATELLRATDFPGKILSKRNLRLAAWVHATGFRDYAYLIESALIYYNCWKKCDGQYDLPPN